MNTSPPEKLAKLIADGPTLLAAALARHLGAEGHAFVFPGRVLAEVLMLTGGQQAGSNIVLALCNLGLIRRVSEGSYAQKKAAEYVWVAAARAEAPVRTACPAASSPFPAGAVTRPQPAAPPAAEVAPPQPSTPRPPTKPRRVGWSATETAEHRFRSEVGGYLTPLHYLVEKMLARQRARRDRELPHDFWQSPDFRNDYGHQAGAAKRLLAKFTVSVILEALRRNKKAFSLAPAYFADACAAVARERAVQQQLLAESRRQEAEAKAERERRTEANLAAAGGARQPTEPLRAIPRPAFAVQRGLLARLGDL